MEIRQTRMEDLDSLMRIYEYAREFMKKTGNPNQWGNTQWPPKDVLIQDIESGHSYVCVHEEKVVGTFYLIYGKDIDSTYNKIYDGKWLDDRPYGVIHRIAGDGSVKGIGQFCINWAYKLCGHLRIDTHGDNKVLQNLLKKLDFQHCGTIYVQEDNDPRLAYEKVSEDKNLEWETLDVEHVIQDQWMDLRKVTYQFPDGKTFSPFYNFSRKDYVVIVATDENGNYICVRQYRQGLHEVTNEFPAGGTEKNEDFLDTAKRELLEETGYVSDDWQFLLKVPSYATLADNYAYIYQAKNCKKVDGQHLDETEFLNVYTYSDFEIDQLVQLGKFQQAMHVMAWLLSKR